MTTTQTTGSATTNNGADIREGGSTLRGSWEGHEWFCYLNEKGSEHRGCCCSDETEGK